MASKKVRMKKSGRLTKEGLSLIACFKFNAETKGIDFKGLANDFSHASTAMTGDRESAQSIRDLCKGKIKKFRYPNTNWYFVAIDLPYNQLIDPDEITKFIFSAKKIAEVKLAAIYAIYGEKAQFKEGKNPFLVKEVDPLKEALKHITSDIPQLKKPVVDKKTELNVEEEFDEWSIYAKPDET